MYLRLGFAQALVHGTLGRQAARGGGVLKKWVQIPNVIIRLYRGDLSV